MDNNKFVSEQIEKSLDAGIPVLLVYASGRQVLHQPRNIILTEQEKQEFAEQSIEIIQT